MRRRLICLVQVGKISIATISDGSSWPPVLCNSSFLNSYSAVFDFYLGLFLWGWKKKLAELILLFWVICCILTTTIRFCFGLVFLRFLLGKGLPFQNQDAKYHKKQDSDISLVFLQNVSKHVAQWTRLLTRFVTVYSSFFTDLQQN